VAIQRVLPGISTEQLRSRLHRMVADGLLTRQRYREVPPRVDYELTERARDLMPVLGALAHWGYDWAWSEPRDGEDVDVGAVMRLAPGLVRLPRGLRGTVAIGATGRGGGRRDYVISAERGQVTVEERSTRSADARVSGSERAWVEAFGPAARRDGLRISGDRKLAKAVLDGLGGDPPARSAAAA
jgi:hypothetical protein